MDLYAWVVFLHVAGSFAFVAGHGVSLVVAFRVRSERQPDRIAALLDVSAASLGLALIGLLVLLVAGIVAGIMGGWFGRAWIWLSLALLFVVGGSMTPLGAAYFGRIRAAVGQRPRSLPADAPDPAPLAPDELAALLHSRRPELLTAIGAGGFVVILWLMLSKPW